ncbi:MAG: 7-cyano-7-deazaguanine synthase QueC [Promethearchaeota archaeon]
MGQESIVANNKKAVVLCSGGLDSTTVLYYAIHEGYEVYPISFYYKQRHQLELLYLKRNLEKLGLLDRWKVFELDFNIIKSSALTDYSMDVPAGREPEDMVDIPVTYVPLRNTIFLSYAGAYAEANNIEDIFIGVNVLDYSGYPDCRPEYLEAMTRVLNLGSRYIDDDNKTFRIHAPLINKSKKEIIELGLQLGVDYSLTWSCYDPKIEDGKVTPCGVCDSCILRKKGFEELGIKPM